MVLHDEARLVGIPWMVLGLTGYVLYRRHLGISLWEVHKIEHRRRPVDFKELAYRSALVPIFGTDVSARAMRSAAKLVGPDAEVDAVYVLRVPAQLSLDAGLEKEEAEGLGVLEAARLAGRDAGLKVRTALIRTRNPGAALVDEAKRRGSEVVYLATIHAPPSERALGPTAAYLLEQRPCRIVVETDNRENGRLEGATARAASPAR